MVTTEIRHYTPVYEPTVQDKIQRVLYRLDSGEHLFQGRLRHGNSFCVMGLFADECGIGRWEASPPYNETERIINNWEYYVDSAEIRNTTLLSKEITQYYDLRTGSGAFRISDLPEDLRTRLSDLLWIKDIDRCSLSRINDDLLTLGYSTAVVNDVLASVIRSGVIFKANTENN